MRMPVSREETKQKTREALVEAALELFARDGLDASLDAICERAGFTRGAFYVHFADREELLVAVMDHVGQAFLASVFAPTLSSGEEHRAARRRGALRTVAERFLDAVKSGAYPLMASAGDGKKPMVKMHQLLDACARSAIVRERYRGLVEMSIASVGTLVRDDKAARVVRGDVDAKVIASTFLAVIIGAQTMSELGVSVDADAMGRVLLRLLDPPE